VLRYYLPVLVFGVWSVLTLRRLPNLRDRAIVRRPESQVWSPWRFLNASEWTELGLRLRWRYVSYPLAGAALALLAEVLARSFIPE
jgi:hypothetical protein